MKRNVNIHSNTSALCYYKVRRGIEWVLYLMYNGFPKHNQPIKNPVENWGTWVWQKFGKTVPVQNPLTLI